MDQIRYLWCYSIKCWKMTKLIFTCLIREKARLCVCMHPYTHIYWCTHMWFGEDGAKQGFMDILPCFEDSNEYQVEPVIYICVLLNVWQDDIQGTEFESFFKMWVFFQGNLQKHRLLWKTLIKILLFCMDIEHFFFRCILAVFAFKLFIL